MGLLTAHAKGPEPEWPEGVRASAPGELVDLLAACLHKRPGERPESARALGEALTRIAKKTEHDFGEEAKRAFWADVTQEQPGSKPIAMPPRTLRVRQRATDFVPDEDDDGSPENSTAIATRQIVVRD